MARISASGATPAKASSGLGAAAMMPATSVPWPSQSTVPSVSAT
ncbi:Uncharacterised protein [Mycobacteroides abscessus subsp. abscessus]|nr:Uncharacterised protein [Mycobacteroides abscessus subsp. abscessus]